MSWRVLTAAVLLAGVSVSTAYADEWFVVEGQDRSCEVVDMVLPGYGKLAGPYATESEAEAERAKIARCDRVNTDPDPDEDEPNR